MSDETEWGKAFAALTQVLVSDFDLADLLHRLADASVQVCGAVGAGIVVADKTGSLKDVAYSGEEIRRLERLQLATGEGPCVECFHLGRAVHESDLSYALDRWPRFVPQAALQGIHSADALPLRLRGRTVGALNLFHAGLGPTGPDELRAVQALADLAMLGIVQHGDVAATAASVEAQVRSALAARSVIERAKGILAEHGDLDMDEAFGRLRRYADIRGIGITQAAQALYASPLDAGAVLGVSAS